MTARTDAIEKAAIVIDRLLLSEEDGGLTKGAITGIYLAALDLRAALALAPDPTRREATHRIFVGDKEGEP
jgi:hypothetical protein